PTSSTYLRPGFHCAAGWPCSAAYSREVSVFAFSPSSERDMECEASAGAAITGSVPGELFPSKAMAGPSARPSPITTPYAMTLDIRITRLLNRPARMSDGTLSCRLDLLGVFPQIA